MSDTTQDGSEVLETTEETVEETKTETTEEATPETPQVDEEKEQLKKDKEELEKKNRQLFERLKKVPVKSPDLSSKDVLALVRAQVSEEDMDEVIEFAAFKKISVPEALKSSTLRTILSEKSEERKTASVTQTKGSPRGTTKISGEDLLARAERTGEVPEKEEELAALIAARTARRIGNRK